jgi:tetratricopeptide (TPR) repeat protein
MTTASSDGDRLVNQDEPSKKSKRIAKTRKASSRLESKEIKKISQNKLSDFLVQGDYRSFFSYLEKEPESVVLSNADLQHLVEGGFYSFVSQRPEVVNCQLIGWLCDIFGGKATIPRSKITEVRKKVLFCIGSQVDLVSLAEQQGNYASLLAAYYLFRVLPSTVLLEARSFMSRAAQNYEAGGDYESATRLKMRLASLVGIAPFQDEISADGILKCVIESKASQQLKIEAEVQLLVRQVRLGLKSIGILKEKVNDWHSRRNDFSNIGWIQFLLAVGEIFILFGIEGGVSYVREAVNEAEKLDYAAAIFQGYSKIGSFALSKGEIVQAREAFNSAHKIAVNVGFLPGAASSLVSLLHCHITQGRSDEALAIVAQIKKEYLQSESSFSNVAVAFSSALHQLGMMTESLDLLQRVIIHFRKLDETALLSQAHWIRGTIYTSNRDFKKARRECELAIGLDEERGDFGGVIDKLLTMVQTEVSGIENTTYSSEEKVKSRRNLKRPAFENATKLLDRCRALKSFVASEEQVFISAKIFQVEGEILFLSGKRFEALVPLRKAREIFVANSRSLDVANIDAMSGLVALEIAKNDTSEYFGEAYESFQRARLAFQSLGLHQEVWKMHIYSVLALEGAMLLVKKAEQRTSLTGLGDDHLERAWGVLSALERQSILSGSGSFFLSASKHHVLSVAFEFAKTHLKDNDARFRVWSDRTANIAKNVTLH